MTDDLISRLLAKKVLHTNEDGYTLSVPINPDGSNAAARIAALEAALKPFARMSDFHNHRSGYEETTVYVKELRAAAAALKETE